jgi:hypothetical protein
VFSLIHSVSGRLRHRSRLTGLSDASRLRGQANMLSKQEVENSERRNAERGGETRDDFF